MAEYRLENVIDCPIERKWALFFDDAFNVEMYEQGLGFPKCEIAERRDDGEVLHRRMICVPKLEVPKALAKIVGDRTGYEEIGDWVRSAGEWRWRLVLSAFGDKVAINGTMRLEPLGEGKCKRVTVFTVAAKVFGIGKIVEKTAADNVISGWSDSARWINGWLARNPA
ncbi:DUF2505 domain-containing protein [Pseudenhygromyxa sp. WMMC2535]|uniref:DUF2505 domain-containing protein n=1 Tax=Pseudenhygromyxa sp. WMMC2535 TaxID=2712867 RepID=UPI001556EDCF|nr:DUF2505 domain-containing protein [Pseudenhygromyxa sp. WMMC2535]NVB39709.1 DUF2505 domain-containing protein [Pseudenhygromyxa sp. WMMC2535]